MHLKYMYEVENNVAKHADGFRTVYQRYHCNTQNQRVQTIQISFKS